MDDGKDELAPMAIAKEIAAIELIYGHVRSGRTADIGRAPEVDLEEWASTEDFLDADEEVARAADYADDRFIGSQLKLLIAAYPGSRLDATSAGLLACDVLSAAPSRFAIMSGCQEVRRTLKFAPSIAEVLAAIAKAEERIRKLREWMLELRQHAPARSPANDMRLEEAAE